MDSMSSVAWRPEKWMCIPGSSPVSMMSCHFKTIFPLTLSQQPKAMSPQRPNSLFKTIFPLTKLLYQHRTMSPGKPTNSLFKNLLTQTIIDSKSCLLGDLNENAEASQVSVMNVLFKTNLLLKLLHQLKSCFLGDLNNEYAEPRLPQCHWHMTFSSPSSHLITAHISQKMEKHATLFTML